MTKDEALKLALEALEKWDARGRLRVIAAIKEALAQPEQEPVAWHAEPFKPDWDMQAVLVEEQQRMAQRICELEALLESQTALLEQKTARIVDLQTHIANLEGEE